MNETIWKAAAIASFMMAVIGWTLLFYQAYRAHRKMKLIRQLKDAMGVDDKKIDGDFSRIGELLLREVKDYPDQPVTRR